jgi:hypothetical protein
MPRPPGSKNKVSKRLNYRNIPYKDWPEEEKEKQRKRARECNARRYARDPTLQLTSGKRWYYDNLEDNRQKGRDHYYANHNKILAENKERYWANRDEFLARRRELREMNKDWRGVYDRARRWTKKGGVVHHITKATQRDIDNGYAIYDSINKTITYPLHYSTAMKPVDTNK